MVSGRRASCLVETVTASLRGRERGVVRDRSFGALSRAVAGSFSAPALEPQLWLTAASLTGWALMSIHAQALSAYCLHAWAGGLAAPSGAGFASMPPLVMAAHWLAMILAMTPPLIWRPVAQLTARGGGVAVAKFLAGYSLVWLLSGAVLAPALIILRGAAGAIGAPPVGMALAVAVLWQLAPPRRAALASCGNASAATGGGDPTVGPLRRGVRLGVGCLGACWALMLAPLSVQGDDRPMMAVVMALLIIEREAVARGVRLAVDPFHRTITGGRNGRNA